MMFRRKRAGAVVSSERERRTAVTSDDRTAKEKSQASSVSPEMKVISEVAEVDPVAKEVEFIAKKESEVKQLIDAWVKEKKKHEVQVYNYWKNQLDAKDGSFSESWDAFQRLMSGKTSKESQSVVTLYATVDDKDISKLNQLREAVIKLLAKKLGVDYKRQMKKGVLKPTTLLPVLFELRDQIDKRIMQIEEMKQAQQLLEREKQKQPGVAVLEKKSNVVRGASIYAGPASPPKKKPSMFSFATMLSATSSEEKLVLPKGMQNKLQNLKSADKKMLDEMIKSSPGSPEAFSLAVLLINIFTVLDMKNCPSDGNSEEVRGFAVTALKSKDALIDRYNQLVGALEKYISDPEAVKKRVVAKYQKAIAHGSFNFAGEMRKAIDDAMAAVEGNLLIRGAMDNGL